MIEKIKQWVMNFFGVQKIDGKIDKLSLTQILFRYVVYLCIICVALDLIVPMYLKWKVLNKEINLVELLENIDLWNKKYGAMV